MKYYNSHGNIHTFQDFYDKDVIERKNYSKKEINQCMKRYNISFDSDCIWVTDSKNKAVTYKYYNLNEHDNIMSMNAIELSKFMKENNIIIYEIDSNDGFILDETEDGDDGYLFIFTNKNTEPIEITENFITNLKEFKFLLESKSSFENINYELRRPKTDSLVFVNIDKLLARHSIDQPDFDIVNKNNQIGNRVQKAKEFILNYIDDNRWIHPRTGERTNTRIKFEPSIVSMNNGKLSFEDGRHRILAAKELGYKTIGIEVPKGQAKEFEKIFN